MDDQVLELGVEGLGLGLVDEVAVLGAPGGDGVDHPVGHLAQRALPLGRAQRPPEVLLGHDVGGVLRPSHRELDVELLEGHRAVTEVRDSGISALPEDLVVGVHAGPGEVAADADARLLGGHGHWRLSPFPRSYPTGAGPQHLVVTGAGAPRCRVYSSTVIPRVSTVAHPRKRRSEGVREGLHL